MKRSTDRILTTHVGSLVRTPEIMRGIKARMLNQPYDEGQFAADVRGGVADIVRKQVEVGIDIPNDGELGRQGFSVYANQRLAGLEPRELEADESVWNYSEGSDRLVFPDFFKQYDSHFRYLWMLPEVDISDVPNRPGNYERFRVVAPVTYKGQAAVKQDIDNLKSALQDVPVADAFMTATPPTGRGSDANWKKFYPNTEAYMYAVADALHEEYKAITDAGFILQLDLAATSGRDPTAIEQRVEVLNYALRDIPEEKVRYHHCWGSMNHPHTTDVPLKDIVHGMLKIKAQAYSIEAANPRHEHEWMVWKDVRLPDGRSSSRASSRTRPMSSSTPSWSRGGSRITPAWSAKKT